MGAILAIIAHTGTRDSRNHAAKDEKPANSLRPVEAFDPTTQCDNKDTRPEQSRGTAPEYRVELIKDGLPQRVNKASKEKGGGQTDIEQLDRKPLLRSKHRFHHPLNQDVYRGNPLEDLSLRSQVLLLFVLFSFRFVAATCYKHGKLHQINSLIIAITRNIVLKTLGYLRCSAVPDAAQPLPLIEKITVPPSGNIAAIFHSQSHQITAL